ncbi:MAG: Flp family type IVb pilin [Castellaniella sp.]
MRNFLQTLARDERGVTAVEYGILAAIVVGALLVGALTFKEQLEGLWTTVTEGMATLTGDS